MFGKIFEQMFSGSLVGSGALSFAVWSYVIAHQQPDAEGQMHVDLNPLLLGAILGEEVRDIEDVIEEFCKPDALSRSTEKEGRRLEKEGSFSYLVVNGKKYREMRSLDERRHYQKLYQKEYRKRQKEAPVIEGKVKAIKASPGTLAERLRHNAEKNGDAETVQRLDEMEAKTPPGLSDSQKAFAEKIKRDMAAAEAAEAAAKKESLSAPLPVPVAAEGAEGEKFPEV